MRRKTTRAPADAGFTRPAGPLQEKYFYQELPPDIQMVVLQGVTFRLAREPLPNDFGLLELDDLPDEEVDDLINRNNVRRTISQWLAFAERGE